MKKIKVNPPIKREKVFSKPIKVKFYTKDGGKVYFKTRKTFSKPVKTEYEK